MAGDLTELDSYSWDCVKKALNQRIVIGSSRIIPSKVNRVWLVETDVRPIVVKKSFSGKSGIEFEALVIAKGAGLRVPYPLFNEADCLVTEYIPGETCEVVINHLFDSSVAAGLGKWLSAFHDEFGSPERERIMGDAVLSNFIVDEGEVFGVDLEDSGPGNPMDDVGQMSASILGSEPFFTPIKFDICMRMLDSYEKSSGAEVVERVRPFVSKHLRLDARRKPLFRRTLMSAANSLERGWPSLA